VATGHKGGWSGWAPYPRPSPHGGGPLDGGRANPKEVAARAGHTSVSFTLDRYGHLYPESDAALRERLDAIYSAGQRDQDDAAVVELFRERS
jgi:hypothetical protein